MPVLTLEGDRGRKGLFLSAPCVLSQLLPRTASWVLSKPRPGSSWIGVFVGGLPGLLRCTIVAALCDHNCPPQSSPQQCVPASETPPSRHPLSQSHACLSLVGLSLPLRCLCSSRFLTHICSCCLFSRSPLTSHVALCLLSVNKAM